MRFTALITALFLLQGECLAELDDETLTRATARYKSMIYPTVAKQIAEDIDDDQLTDDKANEWLDTIVGRLATCQLDALDYLGTGIRDEVLRAFASDATDQAISQIISTRMKTDANFQATLTTYSDVRQQCTVMINQEFGINYY